MPGISNCLESLDDLERCILGAIKLAQGNPIEDIGAFFQIVKDLSDLFAEFSKVLPEAKDIDPKEAAALIQRASDMVKHIMEKV